jgi:hypothetical protein
MLANAPYEVTRHPNVQDAIWPVGQKINISAGHFGISLFVDGRDKPGHDG